MNNIFSQLPEDLPHEVFDTLVHTKHLTIERIVSKGHVSEVDFWYSQSQHEWVMVLQGEAILEFTSEPDVHMKPGDYVNLPAYKKHRVKWTSKVTETIWLAIHYSDSKPIVS